jgi:hypothetical protein
LNTRRRFRTPDLTIDPKFVFAETGNSPTVHVFVGDSNGGGFDLNSGTPLTEVTLPYTVGTDVVTGGANVTVDLTSLGSIPSSWTVYARAYCRFYSPFVKPAVGTVYTFGSGASADIGSSSTSILTLTGVSQTGGGK